MATVTDTGDTSTWNTSSLADDVTVEHTLTWQKVLLGVTLMILVLLTLLGNLLVLIAVAKEKRLQTVFNYYVVNLAITDVSVAVTAMSFYAIYMMLGYWPLGKFFCGVWIFCDYGLTFVSIFTLMIISLDRVWSVSWIHHYRTHHTKKKALLLIIVSWVVMVCLWLPPFVLDRVNNSEEDDCVWDPSKNREFVIVLATVGYHGSFIVLVVCYIRVFVFMQKRAKTTLPASRSAGRVAPAPKILESTSSGKKNTAATSQSDAPAHSDTIDLDGTLEGEGRAPEVTERSTAGEDAPQMASTSSRKPGLSVQSYSDRRERKTFITLTLILAGYVICWLPFHVVFDVSAISPGLVPTSLYLATYWLPYMNSTINPILYNFGSPDFRKTFKAILCRKQSSSTQERRTL